VTTYAAQRSAANFIFPNSFLPERWLDVDHPFFTPDPLDPQFSKDTFSSDQRGAMQPFLTGPRNCIGMSLALAEMRLMMALLVWHFDINQPAGMEPLNWETQKVWNNWWRVQMNVEISLANETKG
jgi:cytochrome P450